MSYQHQIFEAREQVLATGTVPDSLVGVVRAPILQSWRRSILSGARPAQPNLAYHGEPNDRSSLRSAADPILSRLAERLSGLEAGVLLADQEANIVRRWVSDSTLLPLLDEIRSDTGFSVSEESVGTNGVGTVVESRAAQQISGPEHFANALSPFTCVGVPIFHPITRRLEAVITMSCRAEAENPLLTPLMTGTAQDIEHRMLEQASHRERALLDAYLVAKASRRAPVAAVGPDIFIAGPRVTAKFDGIDQAVLWEYVRVVAAGARVEASEFGLPDSRVSVVHATPVVLDSQIVGAVVEFAEDQRVGDPEVSAARPLTVAGRSGALATTVSKATRLAAQGLSIVIQGESGAGKSTLAEAVLHAASIDPATVCRIDGAVSGVDGPARFVNHLHRHLEQRPELLFLRHLESLPPDTAAATASILEGLRCDGQAPRIIATLTSGMDDVARRPLQRLLDTIGGGLVVVPPLRDRREDIAEAASYLLGRHRGEQTMTFAPAALRLLMRSPWPGNMRQLDSVVRSLVATTVGAEIGVGDLPDGLQEHSTKRDLTAMEETELATIMEALRIHRGNKMAAAQSIGISRSTLYRKLRTYHLDPNRSYF